MISKKASNRDIDNKASALAATKVGKHAKHLAEEVWVSALIKDLPLTAHKRQSILPGVGASLLDKFQLLEYVKPSDRLAFFKGVLDRALTGTRDLEFLCAVLTRAGYALEREERLQLLVELNNQRQRTTVARCWTALARSATSLAEAQQCIRDCGRDRLVMHRNRDLREFVVTVELLWMLRAVERPKPLSNHVLNSKALDRAEEEMKAWYRKVSHIIHSQGTWAARSPRYANLVAMIKGSAKTFNRDYDDAVSASEKNLVIRTAYARLAAELRYGKGFSRAKPTDPTESLSHWKIEELHTVVRAIKTIGEFAIITSSGVKEFRRKSKLGDHVADCESPSGIIWFSDTAFSESDRESRTDRSGRTPHDLAVHELAHGLSLADLSKVDPHTTKGSFTLADFLCADHFPEVFLGLGRWYSISSGFRIDSDTGLVFLRSATGKEQPITLGVSDYTHEDRELRKEARVYSYLSDYGLLVWHEPRKAEFTDRAYAREDPTETLAELYVAYFGDRKTAFRLIQSAPKLFWYMESMYHKYHADEAVWSSLRARLSSTRESRRVARVLERESSEQSVFRMLTDQEQISTITQLGVSLEEMPKLKESRLERGKFFASLARRHGFAQPIADALRPVLSEYNPGVLLARTILAGGGDLAIASIRGTTERDDLSQQPMYDALHRALGGRLDEKKIFFLDDFHRSKRLGARTFLKRFETVIAEQLSGLSSRAPGHVKSLPKMYDGVVVYTGIPSVADYFRSYARRKGIKNSLKVVDVGALSSEDLAKRLLKKNQLYSDSTLHFFTLEETLLDLPAEMRVVMKESNAVIKALPLRKFFRKLDPREWLEAFSERTGIPRRLLEIDKSDFTSRAALRHQLDEGWSQNKMLKGFARRQR